MRDLTLYIDNLDSDLFVAIIEQKKPANQFNGSAKMNQILLWEVPGYLDLCKDQYRE
jgi:hypothetical protein